jgi:hypothetical protein
MAGAGSDSDEKIKGKDVHNMLHWHTMVHDPNPDLRLFPNFRVLGDNKLHIPGTYV